MFLSKSNRPSETRRAFVEKAPRSEFHGNLIIVELRRQCKCSRLLPRYFPTWDFYERFLVHECNPKLQWSVLSSDILLGRQQGFWIDQVPIRDVQRCGSLRFLCTFPWPRLFSRCPSSWEVTCHETLPRKGALTFWWRGGKNKNERCMHLHHVNLHYTCICSGSYQVLSLTQ